MPSLSLGKGTLLGVGYIKVEADTSAAESKLSSLGKGLAVSATGFLALTAAGAASVKMANDFSNQMLKIQTQAGGTAGDVKTLSAQILNLKNVQQSPMQLADAMYHLKSVGLDNVSAMKDLKVASDLAAVGGSDLEATTNALAGAWRSGIKGAQSFGQAAGTVNAIIGAGNMRMQDFVAAIGTGILPAAKTFGIGLDQVGAALAVMTDEGVPAQDAATRLKTSFSLLGAPTKAAEAQLKSIGLTGLQLADEMRSPAGLVGTVQLLKDHLDASGLSASQQAEVLSRAFGGGRTGSAIMTLVNNVDVLHGKLQQVDSGASKLPAAIAAQQHTLSAQTAILKNNLEDLGIKVGSVLIGPITAFVSFLNGMALPAISRFASALSKPLEGVGQAVSGLASSGFFQALMGTGGKTFSATPGRTPAGPSSTFQSQVPGFSLLAPPRTAPSSSTVPGFVTAAPKEPAAPSGLAQAGAALHTIFSDLAKAIGDVVTAAQNLWGAIQPFVAWLGTTGLAVLGTFARILADQVGPALVAVSRFLKDNSGLIKILLGVYLAPLAARMAVMSTIKSVRWFADLAKDVVMFPFQQVGQIKSSISSAAGAISDFKAPGGKLDDIKLRAWAIRDAFKDGAAKAVEFGKTVGGAAKTAASAAWGTVSGGIQSIGQGLRMGAQNAIAFAKSLGTAIAEGAASAWEGVVSGVSAVGGAIKTAAVATWEFVTAAAAATASAIKEGAAFVIDKAAELGAAVAEGIATAAEWLLNIALLANPIVLIIVGITALIAIIVLIATKTTWFQTIWNAVWGFIKAVAVGVFDFLTHGLGQLALLLLGPIGVLLLLALHWKQVWGAIETAAQATWHFLDQYLFQPLGEAFSFLWDGIIKPIMKFIVEGFLSAAKTIVDGAAKMFGWIPGIGGMLKGAAKAFDNFANSVNASLDGIQPKTVPVTISFNGVPEGSITGHTYTSTTGFTYASGGQIPMSAGTPGKDSVPIMAMPGEFVVNTRATAANLGLLQKINAGQLKGYASGGMVGFDRAVAADMALAAKTDIHRQTTKIVSAYVKANNAYWSNLGAGAGSIPSGAHMAIINAALAAAGVPPPGTLGQWQLGLNTLIGRESGWNPRAQNNTDINAQMGDPSRGLAQTIMSTFLAYVPNSLRGASIFNPIANVAAAIRYIVAVYGDISRVQQANPNLPPMGYDQGGLARGTGWMPKFTLKPERVLSPEQTAIFENLVNNRQAHGGPPVKPLELHVHFNGPVGSKRELENWLIEALTSAKRNNRLAGIVS